MGKQMCLLQSPHSAAAQHINNYSSTRQMKACVFIRSRLHRPSARMGAVARCAPALKPPRRRVSPPPASLPLTDGC
eukprot:288861-Pleurochrysis_carterae.AAC.1